MPMRRLALLMSVLGLLVLPVACGANRGSSGPKAGDQIGSPNDPAGPGENGGITPPSGDPPPFIDHDPELPRGGGGGGDGGGGGGGGGGGDNGGPGGDDGGGGGPVPEPTTMVLVGGGLAAMSALEARRRRRQHD